MLDSNLEKDTPPDGVRKRGTSGKTKSQINAEYFQALEQWLNDVRPYTYSCSFLAGLPYTMMAQQMYGFPSVQTQPVPNFVPPTPPLNQGFGMFAFPRPQPQTQVEEGSKIIKIKIDVLKLPNFHNILIQVSSTKFLHYGKDLLQNLSILCCYL